MTLNISHLTFLLFVLLLLSSCKDKQTVISSTVRIISETGTTFAEGKPVYMENMQQFYDIHISDSLLFLVSKRNKNPVTILSSRNFERVAEIGDRGQGPEGMDFPFFLKRITGKNNVELLDLNRKTLMSVNYDPDRDRFVVEKEVLPDSIWPSINLNRVSDSLFFATGLAPFNKGLYFKWDRMANTKEWVEYYPETKRRYEGDLSFLYRSSIVVNRDKEFVICGLYYFNKILVFDFQGNILKDIQVGDKSFEPVMEDFEILRYSEDTESFFLSVKGSGNYFYCLWNRNEVDIDQHERKNSKIFVFDWNLNHVSTVQTDHVLEEFDVDPYNQYFLGLVSNEEEDTGIYKFDLEL